MSYGHCPSSREIGEKLLRVITSYYSCTAEEAEYVYIHKDDFIRGRLEKKLALWFKTILAEIIPLGLTTGDSLKLITPCLRKVGRELFKRRGKDHSPKNIIIAHLIIMCPKLEFFSTVSNSNIRILDYINSQLDYGFEYNDYCADCRKYSYILRTNEYQEVKDLQEQELGKGEYYFQYKVNEVDDANIFPPQHNLPFAPLEKELKDIEYAMVENPPIALEDEVSLRLFLRGILKKNRVVLQHPDDLDKILSSKDAKTIYQGKPTFDKNLMHNVPKWDAAEVMGGFRYKRTFIYKNPCETRDGVNTTKSFKTFLYEMNYLLLQITKPIPYCGIGKALPKTPKGDFYLMMDITKDGHTQDREVLRIFCEELEGVYPEFPFTLFYKGTKNSITEDFNGQKLKTSRGWGIGMMNCLAGLITGTIIQKNGKTLFCH